ncbi:MAG: AtpZ/AtpI family protein [Coleofasciculus chthonoplastes F3-SA18-01]|uniref:AtpZ/AtpI family protein n=1 Tax=Coleofasciculus chthonoplastes TaxID=64178 RepID=UPI0032F0F404
MAKRPNHSIRRQHNTTFLGKIKDKSIRKLKARTEENLSVLYGLTLMGFVGWSVGIPTLIGVAIGLWLDEALPTPFSWTLTLMLVGLVLGYINAWYWVQQESADE